MIKEFFQKWIHHWKILFKDRTYVLSLVVGVLVYVGGQSIQHFASGYHDASAFPSVGDVILNRIPTYNLEFLYFWGFIIMITLLVIYPLFFKPEIVPFVLKTYGILLVIRTCFVILTNLGPPVGFFYAINHDVNPFFKNDLFFSGHVAAGFLAFLLLKDAKYYRWIFLLFSFVMAVTVLAMHVHYSIDVFAAYFITYGIYALSHKIFNDLNVRFKNRIRLHGWKAMQKRKERRERKAIEKLIKA